MRVSAHLYNYLATLKAQTILGASENDIATYLLTQRLEAMRAAKYHETEAVQGREPA